ncbi:MAG TPA: 1,2-phenylacetyl-CoA epoxidase subunit PaaD [Saprospiraceae bacterium]|nr:1,2-phenylacetyl-CoA epoxidase subunit PaaD [Saprospiraceae bacterium]
MATTDDIYRILQEVTDPEIPVISVVELGIVRDVQIDDEAHVDVFITPTYSGCPAMDVIPVLIRQAIIDAGYLDVAIHSELSPAWTTDWISPEGRKKLKEFGIAPPDLQKSHAPDQVECPHCSSTDTELISFFGSTPCKAAYRCKACLEPFDYFKCH